MPILNLLLSGFVASTFKKKNEWMGTKFRKKDRIKKINKNQVVCGNSIFFNLKTKETTDYQGFFSRSKETE